MEENKELIFSLKFDTDEGIKNAAMLRSAIDADKEALNALNKEIKKNGESSLEQIKSREVLEKRIRDNTKARADELRSMDAYIKATKNATDENGNYNGSITQLRGALSFLTAKWNDLTKEERENAAVGGVLQKETKRLSDQLKELEGSVGDNRRSVGGYLDAIRQAPGAMGKFKAGIDGIGLAMKSNPLGLIVSLLPQITALFNSSGEGADFFAKAMSIVNAIIQEGLKRVVALGGALFKLMTGDVKGAFNDGKAAVSGFSDAINSAVKAGGALADRMDALEVAESKFTVTQAKTRKQIDELLIQARNRTTSEGERIKLLERAEKLEVDLNRRSLALAKERLALIQEENKIKQSDEDEEQARVNEQLARITELEAQSMAIQEKIQVRKDQLADQAAERAKKRAEEEKKRAEKALAAELARLEEIERKHKEALEEAIRTRDELAALDKKEIDERLEMEAFLLDASIKTARIRTQNEKEEADKRVAIKKAEYDAALALSNAFVSLSSLIMGSSEEASEFGKAAALFQLGISTVNSLANTLEAATKAGANVAAVSGPAAPITGPATTLGYYATGAATIFSAIAQARQIIDTHPTPKAKFEQGGIVSGPSHAQGGVKIPGFGIEIEGGEAVINKRSTALFAPILSAINQLGGGRALGFTNYAAMGGYVPSFGNQNSMAEFDFKALAKEIAIANKSQPIYVIPTEIRDKANAADTRKARAGIGYKK